MVTQSKPFTTVCRLVKAEGSSPLGHGQRELRGAPEQEASVLGHSYVSPQPPTATTIQA